MTNKEVIKQIEELRRLQKAFFASIGKKSHEERNQLMKVADDKLLEVEQIVNNAYEIEFFAEFTTDERLILSAFNKMKVAQWQYFATKSSSMLGTAINNEKILDTLLDKYFLISKTPVQTKLF